MVFEHIEQLKREYTDKYVVVDNTQPELRRFDGQTGIVRTVNMNGNALVEFDANLNTGWFDIAIDFLKVIDKPLPKEEPKKAAPKKAGATATAIKEAKPAAKASGGGLSVADMLAAARGEKGAGAPAITTKKEEKPQAGGSAKMSVAEMLAAARGEKSGGTAVAPAAKAEPAPEPESAPAPEPAPVAEEPAATPVGDLPKDVAGIVAYCRKADG